MPETLVGFNTLKSLLLLNQMPKQGGMKPKSS